MNSVTGPVYVTAVLRLFLDLPDTPRRASSYDQALARSLFERGVPLNVVESALLLGSLRRRNRPEGAAPLPPVRSLAYFSSVIDELQQQPLPDQYHGYLRSKADQLFRLTVQKTTFSSDR